MGLIEGTPIAVWILLGQVLSGAYVIGWLYATFNDWKAFTKGPTRGERVERISSWSMALGLSITFMELDIEIPYSRVRTMSIVFLLVEYKEVRLSIFKSYK